MIVESHKVAYVSSRNYAHLCKIYMIIVYKLNCIILHQPKILDSLKRNPHKDPSSETLNGHLHASTNDKCKKHYDLRTSRMYHERPKFYTWKMRKMYAVAVCHGFFILLGFRQNCYYTNPKLKKKKKTFSLLNDE